MNPINKNTINALLSRVRGLEHRMQTVMKFIGLNRDPLQLTDLELANIYKSAEECADRGWSPHGEQMWADTLCRIGYQDMVRIAELADTKLPWLPFMKLVSTLRLAPFDKTLGSLLDEAHANLENLSFVWGQSHGETSKRVEIAAKKNARPRGVLVRQLRRAQDQHDGSPPPELQARSSPAA